MASKLCSTSVTIIKNFEWVSSQAEYNSKNDKERSGCCTIFSSEWNISLSPSPADSNT